MAARDNPPQINRSKLIDRIAHSQSRLTVRDVDEAVKLIFDQIGDALADGDRVELRGFGSFSVRERKPRMGRNPKTGAPVMLGTRRVPHFKSGKILRTRLRNAVGRNTPPSDLDVSNSDS